MVRDYREQNVTNYPPYFDSEKERFEDYLVKMRNYKEGVELPENYVPTENYWLIDENSEICGSIRFRREMNEKTRTDGANIGYDVPPSKRKQGCASIMLSLLLDQLRLRGEKEVLITVLEENTPSIKVIEKNNGVFKDTSISWISGLTVQRYLIHL